MVIEPFNYQKRTNIEEHNQIVDKLNEVVDAVNNIDPNPSEFEQRIDALELSAINQQNAIEGIHTRDALQDTAIQRAEDNVSQLERNVQGVTENVSGLTGQVGQLETETTNLDGRVTDLNGRLTTLAGNQTALETNVTDLGVRVDSVESKNTQQDTAISDIRADAETTKNRLGTAEGNITTLTGQVGQLETDTTNLDGRVTDLNGRLTTLAGNQTALEGRVDSINTEVGQLSTEVGGLETGKVNVAQGTEKAGMYMVVDSSGNVTPQTLDKDFKVDYNMTLSIDSFEAYGDNLFAGVMSNQMTLPTTYNYIFNIVMTGNDADIDWYPSTEQGYLNIIFDRQPTASVWVIIYGVTIG